MRLAFLVATLAVLAGRARADEVACDAPRAGIVACLAGKLCACRLERGGAMTGLPAFNYPHPLFVARVG